MSTCPQRVGAVLDAAGVRHALWRCRPVPAPRRCHGLAVGKVATRLVCSYVPSNRLRSCARITAVSGESASPASVHSTARRGPQSGERHDPLRGSGADRAPAPTHTAAPLDSAASSRNPAAQGAPHDSPPRGRTRSTTAGRSQGRPMSSHDRSEQPGRAEDGHALIRCRRRSSLASLWSNSPMILPSRHARIRSHIPTSSGNSGLLRITPAPCSSSPLMSV